MSENQTITREELEKQIEEAYKEREKLFKPPEQMIIASKVKIVDEEARKLFPELARDLEVNGLINDVCIDEDGFPHDGLKRIRLLGLEQIKALGKLKIVPRDSKCENIPLTKKARIQHLKWSYEYFLQNAKLSQNATIYGTKLSQNETIYGKKIADILAKRYGISRATVYRWIKTNFTEETKPKTPKEHMYKDADTWNPFYGCSYDCVYCKPSFQAKAYWQHSKCGLYNPHEHPERLSKIPDSRIVFVCGDSDIAFANPDYIRKIIEVMRQDKREDRLWFMQSKNPICFEQYLNLLPANTYLLTTLETNRDVGYEKISKAPLPTKRYEDFKKLNWDKKIVTVEPILDFDLNVFVRWICEINPKAVFIGYNSHPKSIPLPEPDMEKTLDLIVALKNKGIRVLLKQMRQMVYK